ncbi:SDR family oxidoreductase [Flavobacteriaceae bacterium]|jgi:NAD(P)-dependent dehydrogenase (short-subunit alcohol dehydrogenase family)|nr:SDR family oxidoreductase [Halieaceae bacterium]MDA9367956.1 SDR family oxidoreductase [Flavobacteriaceae bacterium]
MKRLADKVAIVTGAGSGIGRASALRFAQEGARVVLADINGDTATSVAAEIAAQGGEALALTVDVAQESQLKDMVNAALDSFGELHILFNNACNTDPQMSKKDADFFTFDAEVFHHRMQTNVLAGVLAARFAMPHMLERGSGCILFTSSSSSLKGEVAQFSYGATKAAVNWYVQTLAATFGKQGIRCNGIVPGVIRTAAMERWATDEMQEAFLDMHQCPRLGLPEDVASMATFLASDEAAFTNGALYYMDGGINCTTPMVPAVRKLLK